jgi:multidrug resistance efflux pump
MQRLLEQTSIVQRELDALIPLAQDRLIARNLVDEKRYRIAELQKNQTELISERYRQESLIEQTQTKKKIYVAEREKEIRSQIAKLEPEFEATRLTLTTATSRLKSKTISAAADGQVINVKVLSPGQVVEAGAIMMELVQERRKYFVEAKINVAEIENMRPRMPAEVHFVTLPSKSTPYVQAELISVADNSTINEKTGEEYYIAALDFKGDVPRLIGAEPTLGMPVDVLLRGGRRSVVSYIVEPFRALARKAMKES